MKTRGLVLDARRYRTSVSPPAALEDTSRFRNDGVFTDVTWVRLPSGLWVMSFNGATSRVTIPNLAMVGDRTFELVAIPNFDHDIGAARSLFQWEPNVSNAIFIEHPGDTTITMGYSAGGVNHHASAVVVFSAGDVLVIHCVVNKTGNEIRYYVNGVSRASDNVPALGTMASLTSTLSQGANISLTIFYDGKILPINIYNYALSADLVYARFQSMRRFFGV